MIGEHIGVWSTVNKSQREIGYIEVRLDNLDTLAIKILKANTADAAKYCNW